LDYGFAQNRAATSKGRERDRRGGAIRGGEEKLERRGRKKMEGRRGREMRGKEERRREWRRRKTP